MKQGKEEPKGPSKNPLSEKVIDLEKNLIIGRGQVLVEIMKKESLKKSGIVLPDGVDTSDYEYYIVRKVGNEEFKKDHPEFIPEGLTEVGNIIISMMPSATPILTNNGKEYLQIHEAKIQSQVKPEHFSKS